MRQFPFYGMNVRFITQFCLPLAASDKFESMEEPDSEFCEIMDNLFMVCNVGFPSGCGCFCWDVEEDSLEIGDSEIVSKLIWPPLEPTGLQEISKTINLKINKYPVLNL